jgi:hypothetical protein
MLDGMVHQGMVPAGYGDNFFNPFFYILIYVSCMFGLTVSLAESRCHYDFVELTIVLDILSILLLIALLFMFMQMDDFKKVPDFSTSIGNFDEIRDADPMAVTSLWSSLGMIWFLYTQMFFMD